MTTHSGHPALAGSCSDLIRKGPSEQSAVCPGCGTAWERTGPTTFRRADGLVVGREAHGAHGPGPVGIAARAAHEIHRARAAAHHRSTTTDPSEPGVIHDASSYDSALMSWLIGLTDGSVRKALGPRQGERILDVGCGPGRLTRAIGAAVGPTGGVEGIDAATEMIELATRKSDLDGPARFRVGRTERLPYEAGTFDAIVSRLATHVLPPEVMRAAVGEFRRVLKPTGRCVLVDLPGSVLSDARAELVARGFTIDRDGPLALGALRVLVARPS